LLVVEAFHFQVSKGTVYFAMGFAFFVEMLNLRLRDKRI
jgi:predicted tellurium resistance membrane protein TerC